MTFSLAGISLTAEYAPHCKSILIWAWNSIPPWGGGRVLHGELIVHLQLAPGSSYSHAITAKSQWRTHKPSSVHLSVYSDGVLWGTKSFPRILGQGTYRATGELFWSAGCPQQLLQLWPDLEYHGGSCWWALRSLRIWGCCSPCLVLLVWTFQCLYADLCILTILLLEWKERVVLALLFQRAVHCPLCFLTQNK